MASSFTPQQIEEFLQEFFDVVGARQYVGARYVPIFGRAGSDTIEWDDTAPYEPLTVVMHDGVSYVSRRYVPAGIEVTNTGYWVETYRFNAQVEQYRQEVLSFQGQIDGIRDDMESDYVPFPDPLVLPKYGTLGQVLTTLANGDTKWEDPVVPSDAQAEEVITAWLAEHPEATTTVQNGAITDVKVNANASIFIKEDTSLVTDLNDCVKNRLYPFPYSASYMANISNVPVAAVGSMLVFSSSSDNVVQIYVTLNNTIYGRRKYSSTWSPWTTLMTSSNINSRLYAATNVSDLNDATTLVHAYRYSSNSSNAPTTTEGNVFVYGNGSDNLVQIAVPTSGTCHIRRKWGSSWTAWGNIVTESSLPALLNARLYSASPTPYLSDLNDATTLVHAYRYLSNASNAPTTTEGNVFVYGNGSDNQVQIAVTTAGACYIRRKWGTWRAWNLIKYTQESQFTFDVSPANISTIPKIGVIGDSYASGEIRLDDAWHDIYVQSWPQIVARTHGIDVYNFSKGGATARSFLTDGTARDLYGLLNSEKRNLYVIVLGINEDKSAAAIGTSSDIGTTADTFYGNYSRIITEIQTYSPHSKIVLCKPASNSGEGYQRLNAAIDAIGTYYGVPVIAQYSHPFFQSAYYTGTMVSGHPTPSSYGGMANALTEMLEVCMAENGTYFYDVNYYDLSS